MQVVKDGKPIKSKSLSNRGAQARHFLGEIPRGILSRLQVITDKWELTSKMQ